MDSRQLTTSLSSIRNSSKQAIPLLLNITLHRESWTFHAIPPNPSVAVVTRRQHATGAHTPASSHIALSPQFTADNLLTLQTADPSLQTMDAHISNSLTHPIYTSNLNTSSELQTLNSIKNMLPLRGIFRERYCRPARGVIKKRK